MKTRKHAPFLAALLLSVGSTAHVNATTVVSDTWIDGTRTDPASPTYSEYGTDSDFDGNLESAWYNAGGAMTVGSNTLTTTVGTGSSSWTTYVTPEATPITLAAVGDTITLTWVFSMTGVNLTNASQGFRLAIVDSPGAARVSTDTAPGSSTYAGYAMFINIGNTLGHASPFQLLERVTPGTAGNFLSSSAAWGGDLTGNIAGTNGNAGYTDGTTYTYTFSATRTAANALDITSTMNGTGLNGTGSLSVSVTDATPNSFAFDTFGLRPSSAALSAGQFDTTLFKVEFVPEPSSTAVFGLLAALGLCRRRRVA